MAERLNYARAFPEGVHAVLGVEKAIRASGLEALLLELVKTRASQLNGCAYCIDMHTKDARAAGETEQRLYALSAWRETPFFTPRERAALAWTEAITNIQQGHAPDSTYEEVRREFAEPELGPANTIGVEGVASQNRVKRGGARRHWWLQGRGRQRSMTRFSPQPEGTGPIFPISLSLVASRHPVCVPPRS